MPLTMRPTGLGGGIDKDRPDYTIYCGGWAVGRIYETRDGPLSIFGGSGRAMNADDTDATIRQIAFELEKRGSLRRDGPPPPSRLDLNHEATASVCSAFHLEC
jgi:hypothetical protein